MNFQTKTITKPASHISWRLMFLISTLSLVLACKKEQVTYENFEASNLLIQTAWPDPDYGTQSFYLDTFKLNYYSDLQFLSATNYLVVVSGLRKAKFYNNAVADPLTTDDLDLKPNKAYSVFLTGTPAMPETVFTEDDLTAPGAAKFKVRFANLSYSLQNAELDVQPEDTSFPQPKPVSVVASEVSYKTVSPFALVDTSGPTFRIDIKDGVTHAVLASFSGTKFIPNQAYTVTLGGISGGQVGLTLSITNNVFPY